eukprot:3953525-Prymnesium_polylepis.1
MTARHWERWAHPVPARRVREAAAAAAGWLRVEPRSRRGGELARARPLAWVRWERVQAGARRGVRPRGCVGCVE